MEDYNSSAESTVSLESKQNWTSEYYSVSTQSKNDFSSTDSPSATILTSTQIKNNLTSTNFLITTIWSTTSDNFSSTVNGSSTAAPEKNVYQLYIVMILFVVFLGLGVICLCGTTLGIYKRKRSRKGMKETGQVLLTRRETYDEVDPDMTVTFVSTSRGNNKTENQGVKPDDTICDSDESPYVDCPANEYDTMFTARPHVNEANGNVYQSVNIGNRYSLVKPILNDTS